MWRPAPWSAFVSPLDGGSASSVTILCAGVRGASFACRQDHRMRRRSVLAVGILISVAFSQGACNRTRPQDDKATTREIQARLYHDATLKTRDISIIAQNGLVVLSGQVNSEDEKASAEHLAAAVGGVKQVINQLAVIRPSAAATPPAQQAAGPQRSKGASASH